MARSITFVVDDVVDTEITVTELEDGSLQFDIQVLGTGSIGDLRALFFDLQGFDADTNGLNISSTDEFSGHVTDQAYGEGAIERLSRDASVKGKVVKELGKFDVGVEFGTPNYLNDDIQQTSFVLSYEFGDLSLDMLNLADFGLRYTSVGEPGSDDRTGQEKSGAVSSGVAQNDVVPDLLENQANSSLNVLANDIDLSGAVIKNFIYKGVTYSAGASASVVVSGVTLGTLSVASDGTVTLDADGPGADSLSAGEEISLAFTYTAESPDGSLATADVAAKIVGQNDAPTLASQYETTDEDVSNVFIDLSTLGGDIDGDDDGTTLSYSVSGQPAEGIATVLGTTLAFDRSGGFQDLAQGEVRDVQIEVTATDSHGATTSNIVTISVVGTNDDPSVISQSTEAQEDGPVATIDLTLSGIDIDSDDDGTSLFYELAGPHYVRNAIGVPAEGSVSISESTLIFDPSGGFQGLADGQEVTIVIPILATDKHGATGRNNMYVTVVGTNDAPEFRSFTDGPGDLDIVWGRLSNLGNPVSLNDGSAFFSDGQDLALQSRWNDVSLGDLDGDGDLDIFGTRGASTNDVLLNDGTGNFTSNGQINLAVSHNMANALGDLDGDGDLDAYIVRQIGVRDAILFNDGTGIFTVSEQSVGTGTYRDVALGDIDGDGDLDAVRASYTGGTTIALNDGAGQFTDTAQVHGADRASGAIALADVDGDGDLDQIVAHYFDYNGAPAGNRVYLNDGTGGFTDTGQSLGDGRSQDIAVGDIDGDGDLDAVFANDDGANRVYLNDGAGNFSDSGQAIGTETSLAIELADLDGDGDLDLAVGNFDPDAVNLVGHAENRIYLNDGSGTFTDSGQTIATVYTYAIAIGDIDGDSGPALSAMEDGPSVDLDLSPFGDDPDSDDDGSTLVYGVVEQPVEGSVSINGSVLTFDPGDGFHDLGAGETRDVTVLLSATDRHGATATTSLSVTVTGTNSAPQFVTGSTPGTHALTPAPGWEAGPLLVGENVDSGQFSENLLAVLNNGNIVVSTFDQIYSEPQSREHYLIVLSPSGTEIARVPFVEDTNQGAGGLSPDRAPTDVIALPDGGFATLWHASDSSAEAVHHGMIRMQFFDENGSAMGPEQILVGDYAWSEHPTTFSGLIHSDVAGLDDGSIAVAVSVRQVVDGPFITSYDSYLFIAQPDGTTPNRIDLEVGEPSSSTQTKVTAVEGGKFLVVWSETTIDWTTTGYAQIFNSDGTEASPRQTLAENQIGFYDVVQLADGGFVIVRGGGIEGISIELLDENAASLGPITPVAPNDPIYVRADPAVTALDNGGFAVAWTQTINNVRQTYVQCFDADGATVGDLFETEMLNPIGNDYDAEIDISASGVLTVLWKEAGTEPLTSSSSNFIIQSFVLPGATGGDLTGSVQELAEGDPNEGSAQLTTGSVIAFQDGDLSDSHTVSVSPLGSGYLGELTAVVSDPVLGDGTGAVTWSFAVDDAEIDGLADGETLTQSYQLTIDDGLGGTDTRTVQVSMIGSNDAATITPTQVVNLVEDGEPQFGTGTIIVNDPDSDESRIQAAFTASIALADFTIDAGGNWRMDLNNSAAQILAEGEVEQSVGFAINSFDGSVSTSVLYHITGTNDAPTLAAGFIDAAEDGPVVNLDLSTLGDDIDRDDDGSSLIYSISGQPSEGSAAISGTTLTFDPGGDFQDLAAGETRDVVIEVSATDRHGATATSTVTTTITGSDDVEPVLINGTAENDAINSQGVVEFLTGFAGHDVFIFDEVQQSTITDFNQDGNDVAILKGVAATSTMADIQAAASQVNGDVVIDLATLGGSGQLTLQGTQLADLDFANEGVDFVFDLDSGAPGVLEWIDPLIDGGDVLDFGFVFVGSNVNVPLEVTNNGNTDVILLAEEQLAEPFGFGDVNGGELLDFEGGFPGHVGDCGFVIEAGETCHISLGFVPTTHGDFSGDFELLYFNGTTFNSLELDLFGGGN